MKRLLLLPILMLCAPVWAVVNVNTASQAELEQLPGIGPGRAQAILEERSAHGPFRSLEDLGRVKGLGAKTLAGLDKEVSFEAPAAAPAPPSGAATAPGPSPSGVPWLPVMVVVLLAGLAMLWLLAKRRGATAPSTPQATPQATDSPRKAPAVPRPPAPAAPPAGPAPASAAPPPPRPAGAAAGNVQPASSAPPAPAGAPPRPAGSRPENH